MAIYSVMRDIQDTRRPMDQWKEVELLFTLYATNKYSNQLALEQWAFENGLPFFDTHCI